MNIKSSLLLKIQLSFNIYTAVIIITIFLITGIAIVIKILTDIKVLSNIISIVVNCYCRIMEVTTDLVDIGLHLLKSNI